MNDKLFIIDRSHRFGGTKTPDTLLHVRKSDEAEANDANLSIYHSDKMNLCSKKRALKVVIVLSALCVTTWKLLLKIAIWTLRLSKKRLITLRRKLIISVDKLFSKGVTK